MGSIILTPPPVRTAIRRRDGSLVYVLAAHVRGAK